MKEIIIIGTVALSGVRTVADKKHNEIKMKYPERIIKKATSDTGYHTGVPGQLLPGKTLYAKEMGEGGLFTGLWHMAKDLKSGFSVDMRRIPVVQEAVEICEMFNINPYNLESGGSLLVVSEAAGEQLDLFTAENIKATRVGFLEASNDKKLLFGDRVRFLDKPAPDELRKIL